jgi:hypothetical protein
MPNDKSRNKHPIERNQLQPPLSDQVPKDIGSTTDQVPDWEKVQSAEELLECLLAEQERRWRQGERIPAKAYVEQYLAAHSDTENAAVLVYHEFQLRAQAGEAPRIEEYLEQYATYVSHLRLLY